ncbi:DDE transposase family protein [Chryseobacterium sp. KBW03]|uniref:DDE transposase family protein n=1 Tax=Chryseobacterium sp. KBW03 TaxID=2153362 RepID=UPI000F593459|nr:DDE transposase family protein [Chryseobacterium sp. KBW03]RQO37941.1 DDE transposase family protein [Chryseobacterium sp. KBW03]
MAVSKTQQREHARLLYVGERITLKEVAERVNVTEKTIGRWCKEDSWEELRKGLLTTRQTQLSRWYKQLDAITSKIELRDNIPTNAEADTMSKITSNIQRLEIEVGLGEIIDTAKKIITYTQQINLNDAKMIKAYFDEYINHRAKNG